MAMNVLVQHLYDWLFVAPAQSHLCFICQLSLKPNVYNFVIPAASFSQISLRCRLVKDQFIRMNGVHFLAHDFFNFFYDT